MNFPTELLPIGYRQLNFLEEITQDCLYWNGYCWCCYVRDDKPVGDLYDRDSFLAPPHAVHIKENK